MNKAKRFFNRYKRQCAVFGVALVLCITATTIIANASPYTGDSFLDGYYGTPYTLGDVILDGFSTGQINDGTWNFQFYGAISQTDPTTIPFITPMIEGTDWNTIFERMQSLNPNQSLSNLGKVTNSTGDWSASLWTGYEITENQFIDVIYILDTSSNSPFNEGAYRPDYNGDNQWGFFIRPYAWNEEQNVVMYLESDQYSFYFDEEGDFNLSLTINIVNDYDRVGFEIRSTNNYYSQNIGEWYWSSANAYNTGFPVDSKLTYQQGYNDATGYWDNYRIQFGNQKYQEGFENGLAQAENYNVYTLVETIGNIPATMINGMLSFEAFGVNLATFVKVIFTLLCVLFVVFVLVKAVISVS